MTAPDRPDLDMRVLLLLATARDTTLTTEILEQAGIAALPCTDAGALAAEIERGVGAVLLCEEALAEGARAALLQAVDRQPAWSDLPVMVLTRTGADSLEVAEALQRIGNVTLLERPLRLAALLSNVQTSLRARQRQYQIRDQLVEQERARAELAELARRKDEFLAMLAHELRNPLAPIRNAVHLLGEPTLPPDKAERARDMLERQVTHLSRLVDDLVDMSRISHGTIELRRTQVALDAVLRNAMDTSAPLVAAGRHRLKIDLPDAPLLIDADPVRMAQVFGNLLNNAAKYGTPGGAIDVVAREEDGQVVVRIRDDGIGIAPETLPHVFELFTQERRAQHRAQDGLGIGLTLVKTLVEMHGGRVEAQSAGRGLGAEFSVWLPMVPSTPAIAPQRRAIARPNVSKRHVLVVDDNEDAANSLGMVLDVLGIDNRIVHSGAEALEAVAGFEPDAVLLDIGMPKMDGYEVARRLRKAGHDDVLLVAVTGWSQDDDREKSRQAGFDLHLSKPVDIETLRDLLVAPDGPANDPATATVPSPAGGGTGQRHVSAA